MNKFGAILKNARENKRISVEKLSKVTKIKEKFIVSLEKESWEELPPFATTSGFVRSIAKFVDLDENYLSAVLKRDYPVNKTKVVVDKKIKKQFIWGPKVTFFTGIFLVVVLFLGYLIFQYFRSVSPPMLKVYEPVDGAVVTASEVVVSGIVDSDSIVTVNNQPAVIDQDGNFSTNLAIEKGMQEITIKAVSRTGKETQIKRKIISN